jgi:biotin carboxyl carrier protein
MQNIFARKTSLFSRVLNKMLQQPQYLSGWLATNRHHFAIDEQKITWLTNPVSVLSNLYHYLNMEADNDVPALYAIWDHDQQLLRTSIEFYQQLEIELGCDDWQTLNQMISGDDALSLTGADLTDVRASHEGFQLGMEILLILPYIGSMAGFFELQVNSDLTVEIPQRLLEPEAALDSIRELSPPAVANADEINAPSGGMFYAREAPDRDSFVSEGDHFEKGDPLFIVEVMKMFNKVYAPFAGTIDKCLIDTDATIIKKGQVVLKVTPDLVVSEEVGEQAEANRRKQVVAFTDAFLAMLRG